MTDSSAADREDLQRLVDTAGELAERVVGLQEQLQEKLGVANMVSGLETRTTELQRLQNRQKSLFRVVIAGLCLDLLLSLGLGGMFFKSDNTIKKVDANSRQIAMVQKTAIQRTAKAEKDLCEATQRSWDTRRKLVVILTKPTKLSPQVERLFPSSQVESLRLQIEQSNRNRAKQRVELLASNGQRPVCES